MFDFWIQIRRQFTSNSYGRKCNVWWNKWTWFPGLFCCRVPQRTSLLRWRSKWRFYCHFKSYKFKNDLYRGHQLYISVFMVYFYINVKSQVSLSPNNVLLGSLGLTGRSRDRIPYQATEYFSCSLDVFIVLFSSLTSFLTLQCGRPMEVKACPECKVTIGGTEHKPFRGNTTAQRYVSLSLSFPRRPCINEQKMTGT